MPTSLPEPLPPSWSGRPAGMPDADLLLWVRYRRELPADSIALYFNVPVGVAKEVPPGTEPEYASMWAQVTRPRVDLLVERAAEVVVVELHVDAAAPELGRLLQYLQALHDDNPLRKPLRGLIVSDRENANLSRVAAALSVDLLVLGPPVIT